MPAGTLPRDPAGEERENDDAHVHAGGWQGDTRTGRIREEHPEAARDRQEHGYAAWIEDDVDDSVLLDSTYKMGETTLTSGVAAHSEDRLGAMGGIMVPCPVETRHDDGSERLSTTRLVFD